MSALVQWSAQAALIILMALMLPCAYRAWIGPTPADRLQAIDTITTLIIGVIVTLAVQRSTLMYVDVALALSAFGFIGTLALSRYIAEGKVF